MSAPHNILVFAGPAIGRSWARAIAAQPDGLFIVDPDHGPGARPSRPLRGDVNAARHSGGRALAFVTVGPGPQATRAAEHELRLYRKWYAVTDVYLTLAATGSSRLGEARRIADDARAHGATLVVMDPGRPPVRGDFKIANVVVTFSGPAGRLQHAPLPSWLAHVSSTRQADLITGATAAQARRALVLARQRGAGIAYATSAVGPRALHSTPTYLSRERSWLTAPRDLTDGSPRTGGDRGPMATLGEAQSDWALGQRQTRPAPLAGRSGMRLNLTMHKNWLTGIAAAPLAAALGVLSIAMTGVVVVGFGSGGRLTTISALGLGAAAILAVLATAQASRPPKPVRIRRRRRPSTGHAGRRRSPGADVYGLARLREWVSVGLFVPLRRGLRALRAAPVAWSLATVAGTLMIAVAVSSISRRSLDGNSVVELICAGLAMSVAIAEGSGTARMQRAGLRSREARRGLQRR